MTKPDRNPQPKTLDPNPNSNQTFNPHPRTQSIKWDVGKNSVRIYDAIANRVLSEKASGQQTFVIPAKEAVMLVMTPANRSLTRTHGHLVCDGIVIDFNP